MEIIIRNSDRADKFAAIFQHIKLFTDHIAITCSETHMKMQCMDNAHVAILELSLPASWFDVYHLAKSVRIGFNATFLHRILSSRDKEQQIQLVYSSEDTDNLLIHLTKSDAISISEEVVTESDAASVNTKMKTKEKKQKEQKPVTNTFDKHFELPLIDIEEEGMQIPDIEYTAELAMHSAQFADIITQLGYDGGSM
jgi:Proliferating cell nuclear antigen, N-terminal domain